MATWNLWSIENNGRGVKAVGMSNAFTAVSDNPWAIDYNPAGLLQVKNIQCSAFLVPGQFGMPELRTTALASAVPFSFGTIAFKAERFGFDLYNETEFGAAFGFGLNQSLTGGISFNYRYLAIARYGRTHNVILHGGILASALPNVKLGFTMNNITRATIGRSHEIIPQVCTLGASWYPIDDLLLSIELEKDTRYPASFKWGIEQLLFDALALRAGVANNPSKYSAGISIKYSIVEFGYAGYSHPDLDWTHQIEISFIL
jgi:hypothetical protein